MDENFDETFHLTSIARILRPSYVNRRSKRRDHFSRRRSIDANDRSIRDERGGERKEVWLQEEEEEREGGTGLERMEGKNGAGKKGRVQLVFTPRSFVSPRYPRQ